MTTTVFLCDDDPDAILTAVYDAWASRLGHSHVKLEFRSTYTPELFCQYREVVTDPDKSEKVIRSIRDKISLRAWQLVYRAALSASEERADLIYRFLIGGFHYGAVVTSMLTEPIVEQIWELNRAVGNESHFYREFLRFESLEGNILAARIRPKSHVLPLLTPHFADRISGEDFIILDVGRRIAAIHPRQTDWSRRTGSSMNWYLRTLTEDELSRLPERQEDAYRDLWKTFFRSIAIEQRINPKLQRNMMPLRYREFAPEFED